MAIDTSKSKDWSDIIKNYAQVLAFVIAGIWTYNLFLNKEAPGLESIVDLNTILNKYPTTNDSVNKFEFDVEFKNNGVTSIDIKKVRISVYKFKLNVTKITIPTYVNI